MYQSIDAINQLAHQAVTGEMAQVDALSISSYLIDLSGNSVVSHSQADLFGDDDDIKFLFLVPNELEVKLRVLAIKKVKTIPLR